MSSRPTGSSGAMPAGAMVAVCLAIAAVVGLIGGAVWGQSGGSGGSASPTHTAVAPSSASAGSQTPTGSTTSSPPVPSQSSTPAPTPGSSVPPAPATTTTSADGWRLGPWRITNTDGLLGVVTTARNTSTGTRSADLVLYVYVDGQHIATTTARVTDVPAGDTVAVSFTGTDPWKPGQKVLLLQVE